MRHLREKYERELADLKRELTLDLPREIQRAASMGDLRENAEYTAALERQSYVAARMAQLAEKLAQLSAVRLSQIPHDRVAFGSIVTVRDLASDEETVFELIPPDSSDSATGAISLSSPLGRALLGREVGDEVAVETPRGRRDLAIVKLITLHDRATEDESDDAPSA